MTNSAALKGKHMFEVEGKEIEVPKIPISGFMRYY